MRLFGLNVTRQAPALVARGTSFEARSIVSAAQELPASSTDINFFSVPGQRANIPARRVNMEQVGEARMVPSDPLGDWFLALPDKIEPKQVSAIMRASLAGNLWQFSQLVQRMMESWPTLKKCYHELRQSVASVHYRVVPFTTKDGEDPTESAKEKADTVERAMRSYAVDRFSDEDGFKGMVYDLTDAFGIGLSITELLWKRAADPQGAMEWLPRASAYVHPRNYAFTSSGRIGVGRTGVDDPMWMQLQADKPILDVESKFLVAKFKSKSGSCLGAGMLRSLCWWWVAVVYGRDFALSFAQKFGGPFLDIPYQAGIPQAEVDKLETLAKRAASLGYCVHPNTGEIKVTPAQAMGTGNPQMELMKLADEYAQILLLGQTATTQGTPGKLGEDESRAKVRTEYLEGIAGWIAEILTAQFAYSVVKENYHARTPVEECPTVIADFTEVEDPVQAANRWNVLLRTGQPFHAEEFYESVGAQMPEEGDRVVVGQKFGVMGREDFVVTGQPDYGYGYDDFGNPIAPPQFDEQGGEGFGGGQEEQQTAARDCELEDSVMASNPEGINQYTHRVHVTLDDPAAFGSGRMYPKKQIRKLRLRAESEDQAKEIAMKFYRKKGYANIKPFHVETWPWPEDKAEARGGVSIRHIVKAASDDELDALHDKLVKAREAESNGHKNGEHAELDELVAAVSERTR